MDWSGYEVYHPGVFGSLNTLPRDEARQVFNEVMDEKSVRIEMLRRLLKANGMELDDSDSGIQDLNDWFMASVEADPANPGRLLPEWYSVVNDVALFLGDVIIERCPGLRWEFYTWGKKNVSYQRHVIMGFSKMSNPKVNLDLDRRVAAYGHQIVASRGSVAHHGKVNVRGVQIDVDAALARQPSRAIEPDAFWRWVKWAESQA